MVIQLSFEVVYIQGIIVLTLTETRQLFSRMFVTLKFLKSCFILFGITASVSFVSSILVVLTAR